MAKTNRKQGKFRNSLLAKIHIAVSQLGIEDEDYRDIIENHYPGKRSASSLNNDQIIKLINYFKARGFKSKTVSGHRSQADALRVKAQGMLDEAVERAAVKFPRKLVYKICGVDDLKFCSDVGKLKRMLTILQRMEI